MYLFILLSVIDFCLLIEITEVSLDENNIIKIKSQSKKKKKSSANVWEQMIINWSAGGAGVSLQHPERCDSLA